MFMKSKWTPLVKIITSLFCLSMLAQAGVLVPVAVTQDNTPTVIYQDSFDYTCWDDTFFADGIWSKEAPQFGNNANFTSTSPLV